MSLSSSVGSGAVLSYETVRILVLGDSGVGKSSFVSLVANGSVLTNPSWTIGATVQVKFHAYKEGTTRHKPFIIELFDIGGSNQHSSSRHIFYTQPFHGVMLVHDLTNKKSLGNLTKWRAELVTSLSRDSQNSCLTSVSVQSRPNSRLDNDSQGTGYPSQARRSDLAVPLLLVGTKSDLTPPGLRADRVTGVAAELGAVGEVKVNCVNDTVIQPGSSAAVAFSRFYDKVIENSFNVGSTSGSNLSQSHSFSGKSSSGYSKPARYHID